MTATKKQRANFLEMIVLTKTIDRYGTIKYINKRGRLHRIHGPAIIEDNPTPVCRHARHYVNDGLLIRTVGCYNDGTRETNTYVDGILEKSTKTYKSGKELIEVEKWY